ncbi:MAG: hypothetical protein HN742_14325 [Lentisphaerae bacterium]|jgi:hypothetical protein|nr:hypothetical protein [Lentisphaerota bacterium]MBT4814461.1 hypothetical protein [Lentisphaerota bacterium]MBT5608719.1 hypothetical protein [Lentisphaerota bacterium]MBT7062163.1 hypothetical protein [Lentisphaerota bacterium]MBT7843051.1 hypothetical protein [Lentisphaerota bacterium]
MKRIALILTIAAVTFTTGTFPCNAKGTATAKLRSSLIRQQGNDTESLVKMWVNGTRGEAMVNLLAELVTRDVRLRAMDPGNAKNSILAGVEIERAKSPEDLARMIVLEYHRRRGIDLAAEEFVTGDYLIRKGDLKAPDARPTSDRGDS